MPCSDGRDEEIRAENMKLLGEYKVKVDNLTEMLCLMCSKIPFDELDQKVRGWYSRHLDADRKRVYDLFVNKFKSFNELSKDMQGDELRKIEECLESILN